MIGLEILDKLIYYVLQSARLKDEKPLSLIILAKAESGKTQSIFANTLNCPQALVQTDATAYGIIKASDNLKKFENGTLTHIVIPDLTDCICRKPSAVNMLMSFLNAFIEEGVIDISTFAIKLRETEKKKVKTIGGLITSITPEVLYDDRRKWLQQWKGIGFMSRPIWFSYKYDAIKIDDIRDAIAKGKNKTELKSAKIVRVNKIKEYIELPLDIANLIKVHAAGMTSEFSPYGFRMQINLNTLIKSMALCNNRNIVTMEDYSELCKMLPYFNLNLQMI